MKKRRKANVAWFEGLTVEHEDYFKELLSALAPKYQRELLKRLRELLSTTPKYEVQFTNPAVAMVGRRIVEAFCQEWYHAVPLVFLGTDLKSINVDWTKLKN